MDRARHGATMLKISVSPWDSNGIIIFAILALLINIFHKQKHDVFTIKKNSRTKPHSISTSWAQVLGTCQTDRELLDSSRVSDGRESANSWVPAPGEGWDLQVLVAYEGIDHWTGLRENLQETIGFLIEYKAFL
jgi:hypothetical protein